MSVQDILQGSQSMPFINHSVWKNAQQNCSDVRKAFAHLSQGSRPAKKRRNIKDLRTYLNIASISSDGLLVVKKLSTILIR